MAVAAAIELASDAMDESGNQRRIGRAAVAALFVAAVILVLFWPVLLTDRSPAMRDAAHFYHPLLKWTSDRWLAGGPPLWNPNENTGLPLLADASSSLFYPGRLLLLLPLEFSWCYNLYVVAHVALAALGAYLLARHWQASTAAAAAAAIAYSCGGSVVFQHANVVFLVGAAWLPFAAWATDRMLVGRSWTAAVTLGVVLALMVLGGDPQMAYHALLMAVLYAVVIFFKPDAPARIVSGLATQPYPSLARRACVPFLLIGLAAACGFLLAAVQILPSAEAAAASDRAYYRRPRSVYEAAGYLARPGGNGSSRLAGVAQGLFGQPEPTTHHERAYDFSVPPWRLVEIIWPNVGGRMFPTHRRWMSLVPGEGRVWIPTLYLGLVPLVLALGQWSVRRGEPARAWLSWLVLLFTLGSFGWYGLGWCLREIYATVLGGNPDRVPIGSPVGGLYWLMVTLLPTYASFRYPAKLLVIAALAASQLAARGWDRSLATPSHRLQACWKTLAISSVLLVVACWFGFSWLNQTIEGGSPRGKQIAAWLARRGDASLGPFDLRGSQRDVYLALAQTALVCLAAHWLFQKARADESSAWRWWLLALVAADLAVANYWLVPTAPADTWRRPPTPIEAMGTTGHMFGAAPNDLPRVYRASLMRWKPAIFARTGDSERMAQIAAWERDTLFPKYGLNHAISLVESYGSLKPVDFESFFVIARSHGPPTPGSRGHEMPHPAALQLLGTKFLVMPREWQPAWPDQPPFAVRVSFPPGVPRAEGSALWRLKEPLPRAWIVHDVEALPVLSGRDLSAVDERTREVLFPRKEGGNRSVRDFRTSAVVESDLPLSLPRAEGEVAGETCRVASYGTQRVQIDVTLSSPGLVVLSDTFAPGWIATVESAGALRRADVLRTNRICRGILLPAGEHRITYEYRPQRYRLGLWLSGAAWAALAIVLGGRLLYSQVGRRRDGQTVAAC